MNKYTKPMKESLFQEMMQNNLDIKFLVIIFMYMHSISFGQAADRPFKLTGLYAGIGPCFAFGQPGEAGFSLSFILGNKWGGSLSSKYYDLNAHNIPGDYLRGGGGYIYPFGIPVSKPYDPVQIDNLGLFSVMVIREFTIRSPRIRFGIEAGPSSTRYTEANFIKRATYSRGESNYDIIYADKQTLGLSTRAKVEFPLGRFLGFEFALVSNINKYRSFIGWDAFFNFGYVREKIRPANIGKSTNSAR